MEYGIWILGLIYAGLFIGLSLWFPAFPLIAIFACAPIPTDLSGGGAVKFSLAEINIFLSLIVLLLRGKRPRGGIVVGLATVYLCTALLCSIPSWRSSSLVALVQTGEYLVALVVVFATLARSEEDFRPCFYAFIAVCLFLAISLVILRTPFIYGINKNNCGSAIAAGYLMALELTLGSRPGQRRLMGYVAVSILAGGLIMTLSRGAWLSAIAGTLMIFFLRRQFAMMVRVGVLMSLVITVCWAYLPDESKEYAMKLSSTDWNISMRYKSKDFALDVFRDHPVIGAGVGLRKEYDATNLFFLLLAESGVVGLVAFIIPQLAVARLIWKTHRKIPQSDFSFSVLVIAAAVMFGKYAHGMVDHYWVRGTLTAAWGAVGMSNFVARTAKTPPASASFAERPVLRGVGAYSIH